jgi:hypothetical protein
VANTNDLARFFYVTIDCKNSEDRATYLEIFYSFLVCGSFHVITPVDVLCDGVLGSVLIRGMP